MINPIQTKPRRPGLMRRLAAIIYDFLLLIALFFIATYLILPITGGKSIPPGNIYYQIYLVLVAFVFYGWFWTHGGQTLGMVAWRLRLQKIGGGSVTWRLAGLRFAAALCSWILGLGFFWMWLNPERHTWHDLWSGTEMVFAENSGAAAD